MKILAVETSTTLPSIAFIETSSIFVEKFIDDGKPSGVLLKYIDDLLNKHNISVKDIDLFVVDTGPGSFTGIRVGLSAVMGLSYALSKPAIGVNSFEVLFSSIWTDLPVVVWIDTRQGDVYQAVLRWKNGEMEYVQQPSVGKPEELITCIGERAQPFLFIGDGVKKFKNLIITVKGENAFLPECEFSIPSALILGLLGLKKFNKTGGDTPYPRPFYLKDFPLDKN